MEKQISRGMAQLIREEVKAQLKRYAMAKTRDDFINGLVDVLSPALSHHYRAALGILNRRTDQVAKWRRQRAGFLEQFMDRLVKPVKAKGLDRKKAVEQALKELMENDDKKRKIESLAFQKGYTLKKLAPLPESAHEDFLSEITELIDAIFPS